MPLSFDSILTGVAQGSLQVFFLTWWIIIPLALINIVWEFWVYYVIVSYIKNIKWVLLRIKTPKAVLRTPKAMEQVFAAAHVSYSFGIKAVDRYWKGQVEEWHSFEITGDARSVSFYIRTPEGYRNAIESAIYAQYPEAEIEIADDYTSELSKIIPNDTYNLFGTDFILARESAYPIKTHPEFEAIEPEEKIDTVAAITEAMSRLKGNERIWFQILIRPTDDKKWKKEAEKIRDKLAGRKEEVKQSFAGAIAEFIINLFQAPFKAPEWTVKPEKEKPELSRLTKGEEGVIKSIETKLSKIGFEAAIRFIYIDERANFSRGNIAAVMGALRQLNTLNLNSIAPNLDTMTITRGAFRSVLKKTKVYAKQRQIYDFYLLRRFPNKFSIMNIEELATIYHFPTEIVAAPLLRPVEFKKGAPPTNLPTE